MNKIVSRFNEMQSKSQYNLKGILGLIVYAILYILLVFLAEHLGWIDRIKEFMHPNFFVIVLFTASLLLLTFCCLYFSLHEIKKKYNWYYDIYKYRKSNNSFKIYFIWSIISLIILIIASIIFYYFIYPKF